MLRNFKHDLQHHSCAGGRKTASQKLLILHILESTTGFKQGQDFSLEEAFPVVTNDVMDFLCEQMDT